MKSEIDTGEFRKALGQFATGVTVVTTRQRDGTPRGFTANSFTSVSLDPPLVLVCIACSAASMQVFCDAPAFAVNILNEDQRDVSGLFASQRPDKFEVAVWHDGTTGVPLIENALSWFECQHFDKVDAGDHVVLIGRVVAFGYREGRPLGYLAGNYFTLGLEDPIVDAAARGAATLIGAIFEKDGAVLLEQVHGTDTYRVPAVGADGRPVSLLALTSRYSHDGFQASVEFVYAVFEDYNTGTISIYYRGHAAGAPPSGTAYYAFDEIPFDRISDRACRTMLKRYVDEAIEGGFAVYMGDQSKGIVQPVK